MAIFNIIFYMFNPEYHRLVYRDRDLPVKRTALLFVLVSNKELLKPAVKTDRMLL